MPQLNELQKSIIRTRLEDGMSIRHIANEINVDKNTVLLAKRKIEETGIIR
jgi:transposase